MKKVITIAQVLVVSCIMVACNQNPQPQTQTPAVNQQEQANQKQDEHEHKEKRDMAVKKLSVEVDKINSLTDEITDALKEGRHHDIAKHCGDINTELDGMLNNITELPNDDFTKLKGMLNKLRASIDEMKHTAENGEHNEMHNNFDQFIKDFSELRIAMPKI